MYNNFWLLINSDILFYVEYDNKSQFFMNSIDDSMISYYNKGTKSYLEV